MCFRCYLSAQRKWSCKRRKDHMISFIINWETFLFLILWRGKAGHFTICRDVILITFTSYAQVIFSVSLCVCAEQMAVVIFVQLWSNIYKHWISGSKKGASAIRPSGYKDARVLRKSFFFPCHQRWCEPVWKREREMSWTLLWCENEKSNWRPYALFAGLDIRYSKQIVLFT